MSDKTRIEWTDATWNPVTGCTKVSAGCKHCYAERDWARLSANPATRYYGRAFTDVQCHMDVLTLPLRWTKPRRIFVNSMSDLFHPDVPARFIADVFGIMAACPQHIFQVLTKRPERMRKLLGAGCMGRFESDAEACTAMYSDIIPDWPLPNVWLGVSVEDQATADERIPLLLDTPAAVRWISAEPLLGAVDVSLWLDDGSNEMALAGHLDWIVAGGESGYWAPRPMHPDWVRSLRDQCAEARVPFLFKQWGEWAPCVLDAGADEVEPWRIYPDGTRAWSIIEFHAPRDTWQKERMFKVGKKAAGRLLDGVEHNGCPA